MKYHKYHEVFMEKKVRRLRILFCSARFLSQRAHVNDRILFQFQTKW